MAETSGEWLHSRIPLKASNPLYPRLPLTSWVRIFDPSPRRQGLTMKEKPEDARGVATAPISPPKKIPNHENPLLPLTSLLVRQPRASESGAKISSLFSYVSPGRLGHERSSPLFFR